MKDTTTRPTIIGTIRTQARAAYWRLPYQTREHLADVRAVVIGDPDTLAADKFPDALHAPKSPASYREEWPEEYAATLRAILPLVAHLPGKPRRCVLSLVRDVSEAVTAQRERQYYTRWTYTAARELVAELIDDHREEIEGYTSGGEAASYLADAITEAIDTAVPVYTYDRLRILALDEDVSGVDDMGLLGDASDPGEYAGVAIYEALSAEVGEVFEEEADAVISRHEDELEDEDDPDEDEEA